MSKMTARMRDEVLTAVRMRMNHIETGDTSMSANDAAAFNATLSPKDFPKTKAVKINALSREQRDLINLLEDAAGILTLQELGSSPQKERRR